MVAGVCQGYELGAAGYCIAGGEVGQKWEDGEDVSMGEDL